MSIREGLYLAYSRGIIPWEGLRRALRLCARLGLCVMLASMTAPAWAKSVPDELAVRALVGEAGGQGPVEMYAHACALRNRGHLRGVYGLRAAHVRKEPEYAWNKARMAWARAVYGVDQVDMVDGRTEWLSEYDLRLIKKWSARKRARFMSGLKDPLRIGETTFYRRG